MERGCNKNEEEDCMGWVIIQIRNTKIIFSETEGCS